MLASGLGAAITDTIFNPLEMLKVRVQTSETTFPAAARAVWAKGGPWLLWTPGLQATWVRSFCVTGLRVGLYGPVKRAVSGDAPTTSFATKFAVGGATGALSAALANPIDMVRTRVHAQVGLPTRYTSTAAAALHIVRHEGGVAALWRGLGASAARQVCLSGGQLATYDSAKQAARGAGVAEGPLLHVVCARLSMQKRPSRERRHVPAASASWGGQSRLSRLLAAPRTGHELPRRAGPSGARRRSGAAALWPGAAEVGDSAVVHPQNICYRCAALSGFVGQLCCMPADVIKVKVLSGDHGPSALGCLRATLRAEQQSQTGAVEATAQARSRPYGHPPLRGPPTRPGLRSETEGRSR